LDVRDYQWLVDDQGRRLLDAAIDDRRPLHAVAESLRREVSAERARLVLSQVELRRRGRGKFRRADQMFFTDKGLQQATDEHVANYKAGRFAAGGVVADLCCGIGGDLCGLAARGAVRGVERCEATAVFAAANLRAHDVPSESENVRAAAVEASDVRDAAAWHIDPDRRADGRRGSRVEHGQPSIEEISQLLAVNPRAAIKLAPAARLPEAWAESAEQEWISRGGECRQLVAWMGALATSPGRRAATLIAEGGGVLERFEGETDDSLSDDAAATTDRVGRFVFEPDAAVLAARLAAPLARKLGLEALTSEGGYLTGDGVVASGALAAFEVIESMPLDLKRLRKWLHERRIGRLEIKKRGAPIEPATLRAQLQNRGEERATLLICRVHGAVTAIVARRITPGEKGWPGDEGCS
jgi:hypothetical protein